MKIATFNINNVNKRLSNLRDWLRRGRPDAACLQELKTTNSEFPIAAIEKAGYGAVWIFGPVAPVASFDDEEAAVAAANDTEYGLVAYVYTSDIKRAFRVVEGLDTGMVGLNQGLVSNPAAPFGGVKQSGFGREGGAEGIHEYLEVKYVAMNL